MEDIEKNGVNNEEKKQSVGLYKAISIALRLVGVDSSESESAIIKEIVDLATANKGETTLDQMFVAIEEGRRKAQEISSEFTNQ